MIELGGWAGLWQPYYECVCRHHHMSCRFAEKSVSDVDVTKSHTALTEYNFDSPAHRIRQCQAGQLEIQ